MTYACHISEQLTGFRETDRVVRVLEKYNLPTYASFDKQKAIEVMKMDKKRERKELNYILLEKIGKGVVKKITIQEMARIMEAW
jgi:3-dehydroquinate synthase